MMEITLPDLHQAQREIWEDDARFIVLDAGRRFGKSKLGSLKLTVEGLRGRCWWWVWPTYTDGTIGWEMLKELATQIPGVEVREVERRINYPSGGWAQIKSADRPESLRGRGLDGAVLDEAGHMRKFVEVWEQSLRPSLSDRQGKAWFISTPKGFNHFFEMYRFAQDHPDWSAYQFPTSSNPFIVQSEIDDARSLLPELVFRQEYMAEFVQLAGALFKREYFDIKDDTARFVSEARFWDLAASLKEQASYTAGARVGITAQGDLQIVDVVRGRWEWPDAIKIIKATALSDGAGVGVGVEDVGTQKGMFQLLISEPTLAGISLRPVRPQSDKITRAMPWLARAEQGKVSLYRGAWNMAFLDEVCAFPETEHDDQVDAVSGAVQMLGGVTGAPIKPAVRQKLVSDSKWTAQTSPRWKRSKR